MEIRKRLQRMTEFVDATIVRFQERQLKIDEFKFHSELNTFETPPLVGSIR